MRRACLDPTGGAREPRSLPEGPPEDVQRHFVGLNNIAVLSSPGGGRVLAKAETSAPAGHLGFPAVTFKGSYVGGDNYVIQSRLTFEGFDKLTIF